MCRSVLHKTLCRMRVLLVKEGYFGRPAFLFFKPHPNTRRSRVTAPADLEHRAPQKVGVRVKARVRVRPGVGFVWADVRVRLKLTTHVLDKVMCRTHLHIAAASRHVSGRRGGVAVRRDVAFLGWAIMYPHFHDAAVDIPGDIYVYMASPVAW